VIGGLAKTGGFPHFAGTGRPVASSRQSDQPEGGQR
jgi:hypothetical protein